MDGIYNGAAVKVGVGACYVNGQKGIVSAVVEEGLCEFVQFFRPAGTPYGVLVWFEGFGYGGGDVLRDGSGNKPAENGAASYRADAAVGFEKRYDSRRGKGVKSIGSYAACGKVGEGTCECLKGLGVGRDDAVVFIAFASRARSSVSGCVGEEVVDISRDCFDVGGLDGGVGGGGWQGAGGVVWEKLREFGLNLVFTCECGWSLQDFEGLGKVVVV